MGIISLTPTTPTLTVDQLKFQYRQTQDVTLNIVFLYLKRSFDLSFDSVWNNPDMTPQQVFDAYGTDAVQLFMIAAATQAMLNAIVPGSSTQVPPYHYTINQDGTVTVGEKL